MPLPSTGPMSYLDLSNEFGGRNSVRGVVKSYTVPGTYTYVIPAGATTVETLLVGGGGGGGRGVPVCGCCAASGGGGGGGGQVTCAPAQINVTPGETLTIIVGAGGVSNGGSGGESSITGLFGTLSAGGGQGGQGQYGGSAAGGFPGGDLNNFYGGSGGGGAATAGNPGRDCWSGGNAGFTRGAVIPGTSTIIGVGGGGGGGAIYPGSAGAGGDYINGFGGSYNSYATNGLAGTGQGGGGGGGNPPYQNGAPGGSGGVYFYIPSRNGAINIEDYYRGQGYVPDVAQNSLVPYWTSGVHPGITVTTDFRNAVSLFTFNYTVANGSFAQDLCILAAATAAGYQNDKPLVATININGVLGASSTAAYALSTGYGYNTVPTISIIVGNTGVISGHGGGPITCSEGSIVGGDGGTAIQLYTPTIVYNNGIIQGGGAASNVAQGAYAGGAGYGYGVGVQGNQGTVNQIGTLFSGGAAQTQKTGKKSSASTGYGGGWVSECGQSPSTDGYSNGGSYIPGNGFTSGSISFLSLSVRGTIRGLCGL